MYINRKFYIRICAVLIGIALALCTGLGFLFGSSLTRTAEDSGFVFCVTVSAVVLSLLVLGLISLSIKAVSRKPAEKIHALLERFKDGLAHPSDADIAEIAAALEEMMGELRGLLQSIQTKAQAIDRNVEELAKGIQQVAADQTNLFSLNAAIELVRSQQDGFSVISSEILSLVERTGCLTGDIRNMADRLRVEINEVIAELERVLRQVGLDPASMPTDKGA